MDEVRLQPGWLHDQCRIVAHEELMRAWEAMEHAVQFVITARPAQMIKACNALEESRLRVRDAVNAFKFWELDDVDTRQRSNRSTPRRKADSRASRRTDR